MAVRIQYWRSTYCPLKDLWVNVSFSCCPQFQHHDIECHHSLLLSLDVVLNRWTICSYMINLNSPRKPSPNWACRPNYACDEHFHMRGEDSEHPTVISSKGQSLRTIGSVSWSPSSRVVSNLLQSSFKDCWKDFLEKHYLINNFLLAWGLFYGWKHSQSWHFYDKLIPLKPQLTLALTVLCFLSGLVAPTQPWWVSS